MSKFHSATALATAFLFCCFVSPAEAVLVPITNAGFETDPVTFGSYNDFLPTGWSKYEFGNVGGTGVANPNVADPDLPAAVGSNYGYVYSFHANSAATLYQQVDTAFAANTQYTLSVLVGDTISNGGPSYTFPETMRIGIYNSTSGLNGELTSPVATTLVSSPGDGLAAYYSATFTTTSTPPTGPIVIGFSAVSGPLTSGVLLASLDDITLSATLQTSSVPEPASFLLLTTGIVATLSRRRRR